MNAPTSIPPLLTQLVFASWNIGAGKRASLTASEAAWSAARADRKATLDLLIAHFAPDWILLQEVGFRVRNGMADYAVDWPDGYHHAFATSLDSRRFPGPLQENSATVDFECIGQGLALLWKCTLSHAPLWSDQPRHGPEIAIGQVRFEDGLYAGDRDSEPRIAQVAHFVVSDASGEPRHVFLVNLHLTTVRGEREGLPERDDEGSRRRQAQLKIVLDGIVSRMNAWRTQQSRPPAVWIIGGDLNAAPESLELDQLRKARFLDLCPAKAQGTKRGRAGTQVTHTVDYLLAGIAGFSLRKDASFHSTLLDNPEPIATLASDHLPVVARLPLLP